MPPSPIFPGRDSVKLGNNVQVNINFDKWV